MNLLHSNEINKEPHVAKKPFFRVSKIKTHIFCNKMNVRYEYIIFFIRKRLQNVILVNRGSDHLKKMLIGNAVRLTIIYNLLNSIPDL